MPNTSAEATRQGFLNFQDEKLDAEKYITLVKARVNVTDSWMVPPGEPENMWMIYIESDASALELDEAMVEAERELGNVEEGYTPLAKPDNQEYHYEGPYTDFPYSGGYCQTPTYPDIDTVKPHGVRTPYEVRLEEYGDDPIYVDNPINNWQPMCWDCFMIALEGGENYIRGGEAELRIRLVRGNC
jgi:hypothetical protein